MQFNDNLMVMRVYLLLNGKKYVTERKQAFYRLTNRHRVESTIASWPTNGLTQNQILQNSGGEVKTARE